MYIFLFQCLSVFFLSFVRFCAFFFFCSLCVVIFKDNCLFGLFLCLFWRCSSLCSNFPRWQMKKCLAIGTFFNFRCGQTTDSLLIESIVVNCVIENSLSLFGIWFEFYLCRTRYGCWYYFSRDFNDLRELWGAQLKKLPQECNSHTWKTTVHSKTDCVVSVSHSYKEKHVFHHFLRFETFFFSIFRKTLNPTCKVTDSISQLYTHRLKQ